MGEARQVGGLSDAPGRRAAGGVAQGSALTRFLRDESGATAVEYGLIVSLIFLAIVTAVSMFGNRTTNMFNFISNTVGGAIGP
jgi:pilus assembly protein Flp/PilA